MNDTINGELFITLPEGFRAMSTEELKRGYATDFERIRGYWDEEHHVIISITWNESSRLLVKLTSPKDLAKRAEKHLARSYKGLGYRNDGFFATEVAGQDAQGFRYAYEIEGVAQSAETIVFMHGKCCYTLYYYTRSEDAARNVAIRDQAFASLAFR